MTDFKFKCGSCRNFEPQLGTPDGRCGARGYKKKRSFPCCLSYLGPHGERKKKASDHIKPGKCKTYKMPIAEVRARYGLPGELKEKQPVIMADEIV